MMSYKVTVFFPRSDQATVKSSEAVLPCNTPTMFFISSEVTVTHLLVESVNRSKSIFHILHPFFFSEMSLFHQVNFIGYFQVKDILFYN